MDGREDLLLEHVAPDADLPDRTADARGDRREAAAKVLRLAIIRQGTLFFWPIKLRDPDGRHDSWSASALVAATEAEKAWVSVKANQHGGAYEVHIATANIPEPRWDEVLDGKNLQDLLRIAFRDRVIDTPDHSVIKQLRWLG